MNQYTSTPFDTQAHDENGNLGIRTTAVGSTVYYYDYANRLVQIDVPSGQGTMTTIASYAYDALGRRIRKILNPGPVQTVIQYAFSADSEVLEERVNGILSRTYVLPQVGDEVLVAFNQAGDPLYYHYDDMGNTLALSDASGAVVEGYSYDEYGKVTFLTSDGFPTSATSSAVGNVYCWGGLRHDSETGLHNDDGGYFDPQMGRWITSIGLPKITPKIAKEHHGKFRTREQPLRVDRGNGERHGEILQRSQRLWEDCRGRPQQADRPDREHAGARSQLESIQQNCQHEGAGSQFQPLKQDREHEGPGS